MTNVTSTDFPHHYPGEDHAWSIAKFGDNLRVQFHKNAPLEASFSLIGVDASIANAFRRILIDEIPTLAIEIVYVHENTSIVQDEVLAQRLGLVPLTGAEDGIRWLKYHRRKAASLEDDVGGQEAERTPQDNDTVVLKLEIECKWNPNRKKDDVDTDKLYINSNVYAKHITFDCTGRQKEFFKIEEGGGIRPVHPDILLAKMRPGQGIRLDMHAVKGVGADHAKFSPVATATYRLLPTIDILKPIVGDDAVKFARCFPKGVIALEDVTEQQSEMEGGAMERMAGRKKAVVRNPMRDTVSRECLRHPEFEGKVKLGRVRDHFIFNVESTGQYKSDWLFLESVKILRSKCKVLQLDLANLPSANVR